MSESGTGRPDEGRPPTDPTPSYDDTTRMERPAEPGVDPAGEAPRTEAIAPQAPAYDAAGGTPGPPPSRWQRFRERAWGLRSMVVVALAALIIGGLGGVALGRASEGGHDGRGGPGGHRFGQGGPGNGGPGQWGGQGQRGGPRGWGNRQAPNQQPPETPTQPGTPTPSPSAGQTS